MGIVMGQGDGAVVLQNVVFSAHWGWNDLHFLAKEMGEKYEKATYW